MSDAPKFPNLAKSVQLGALKAKNGALMASLTRNRSIPTHVPNDDNVKYYSQRAKDGGAGLIFTEGTLISKQGTEWPNAPGCWSDEHAKGWKKVTDAVHAEGTQMVAQLWHLGRVCHPGMDLQKESGEPVYGPSAVAARGGKFRDLPDSPGYIVPTEIPEPEKILDQYTNAAKIAKEAGFDGVELHSANGYLVEQFLSDSANVRTDKWGGSVENRCRFGLEAVKRLIDVWGADRVGIKLSPCGGYNDLFFNSHEAVLETFHYYIEQLDALGLAYIQVMQYNAYGDNKWDGAPQGFDHDVVKEYGHLVKKSNFVANCGYDGPKAEKELAERGVKAVTFGQAFIANPDYYRRLQEDLELNQPDYQTFYTTGDGGNGHGYHDYPFAK